nr:hypothetical protein [Tanacetum cinerariifolium]
MAVFDNESNDASVHNEAINTQQQPNIQPQIITTISNNNAKFPYLKKDEYEVWAMKMEYWITNNDMNIWKGIQNGKTMKRTGRDHMEALLFFLQRLQRNILLYRGNQKKELPCFSPFLMIMWLIAIIWMMQGIYGMQSKLEGLHKGYDRMQKILSQLNELKANPDAEDINLKFLRALPSSWSQVALTLKTKCGLELLSFDDLYYKLKTFEVDVKGYNTFSSSQSAGPSHSAFVSTTSASKKMSYRDSPSYSLNTTYSASSNSKTGSHRSSNVLGDVLQSFVADTKPVLITGANSEEANNAGDARGFDLMGVTYERVLQRNQLTLEDKIRVLSIELENTSNLLKHSERINADVETAKKDLQRINALIPLDGSHSR